MAKKNIVVIDRPRASLADVPDADQVTFLLVDASLASWDGLERFSALRTLKMYEPAGIPAEGLAPVGGLTWLRNLTVEVGEGVTGVEALAGLRSLESLNFHFSDAGVVSDTWLGELVALDQLLLALRGGGLTRVPLARLQDLPRLTDFALYGVYPSEGVALFERGFGALEKLEVTVPDEAAGAAIQSLRADITGLGVMIYPGPGPFAPEIVADDGGFDVYLDAVEPLGVDGSNHDALEVIEERLERERPSWAEGLSFDPEADGLSVWAPRREQLDAFLVWLDQQSG